MSLLLRLWTATQEMACDLRFPEARPGTSRSGDAPERLRLCPLSKASAQADSCPETGAPGPRGLAWRGPGSRAAPGAPAPQSEAERSTGTAKGPEHGRRSISPG